MTDATPTPDPVAPQPVTPQAATPPQYAAQPAAGAAIPGKTLGIVALVLSFLGGLAVVGIILGFVARAQSKAAGYPNGPAKAAIIVGFIVLAIFVISMIILAVVSASLLNACAELGTGVWEVNGTTYTCG
jgi:heme/copper-type cytochrome/quinol oxidase subunit 2